MRILVLNCGSSSLKFELVHIDEGAASFGECKKLAHGLVERIGSTASLRFEVDSSKKQESAHVSDHQQAVEKVIEWLRSNPALATFDAVGHRVVHGGNQFTDSVVIDDRVVAALDSLCEIAPLHNPSSVSAIRAARSSLGPDVPMAAVFDTSFHRTIPEHAAAYALPHELSSKHHIRRYGFHGIAHQYSVLRYAELTTAPHDQVHAVTMHLGNGCSACAIHGGKSVDTSMGFTPLEGLVMGTRSGDIDPALVSYLAKEEDIGPGDVEDLLNKRSGLLGVSGFSGDMRELIDAYDANPRARLAVDMFCYRARKYLGAYLAALGNAHTIIFSGGIGEHSPLVREKICEKLAWAGLQLDDAANRTTIGKDGRISIRGSKLDVFVIHTDEEIIIARETARLIRTTKGA